MKMCRGRKLEYLTEDEIERIHLATLDVLENVGVIFRHPEALEILKESGARVDFGRQLVKIPPHLVEEAVRTAPSRFTWHARNPKNNLKMEDSNICFSPAATCPFVYDLETGKRREATFQDAVNLTRLADSLELIGDGYCMVYPRDVPNSAAHAYMMLAMIENTSKCIRGRNNGRQVAKDCIHMMEMVAGGEDAQRQRPNLLGIPVTVPPLQHDAAQIDGLIEYARRGLPMGPSSQIASGATGPVSLAGCLVQLNAEVLAEITLAQFVNPGTPVLYGTVASVMDMRTTSYRYGAAELGMMNAAAAQLARYYHIPSRGSAGSSDSKTYDMQAGMEGVLSLMQAALAGINYMIYTAGGLDLGMSISYEKVLIDYEAIQAIARILRGIEVNEDSLATEVIAEVGPGGHYLSHKHTRHNLKKEHHIPSEIIDTLNYSLWTKKGSKDIRERAREKVKKILQQYEPEPIDEGLKKELRDFVKHVEKRG
jgi:trimethylamine--corrinoid protein Co-methyltransferase